MAELFKFRCYQCQKLIGAPASKFGKVVRCPKCEAELIVPSPEGHEPEAEADDPGSFHPEDIGIHLEPEKLSTPKPSPTKTSALEPVGPDPIAFLQQVREAPEPATPGSSAQTTSPEFPNEPNSIPEVGPEPLVARGRNRGTLTRPEPQSRARDVVLPRTAAVAWALFALLSLAFAFSLGLMVGHFVWK